MRPKPRALLVLPVVYAAIACLLVAPGCGGGGGGSSVVCTDASAPDVDPATKMIDLTPAQKAAYCDWWACQVGGYGAQLTCSSGPAVTVDGSQAECVSKAPTSASCQATLGDEIDCFRALAANPCQSTAFTSSACSSALQCALGM